MTTADAWNRAENILCIRLDSLGDVLMTTPAIRAIKESRSGRRVSLLTSPAGQAISSLVPEIDDVIVYDAPWMKATAPRENSRPEFDMVKRLQDLGFDAAVIFTVFSQNPLPSAILCYLADIPLRLAHCRENPYQLLTNWVLEPEPHQGIRHEVRRQLDLAATVGCQTQNQHLSLSVPELADYRVRKILQELGINWDQPLIVIHPGATASSRCYPPEGFAEVARRLVLEANFQVLFTGTEPERQLVEGIQKAMAVPSHSLVAALNLSELAALIAIASLLISNNTGPVHIASALGTPVIDLYALTNPQHTPWAVPHRVLFHDVPCKFCYKSICPEGHHNCLRLLTPEEVIGAVRELYNEVKEGVSSQKSGVKIPSPLATRHSPLTAHPSPLQSAKEVWQ